MVRSTFEDVIGLGVAGNFAGHLEQAGEASDFEGLPSRGDRAPKGVFPFYVPGSGSHFLHRHPISAERIRLGSDHEKHQIEPELSLLCVLESRNRQVVGIVPREAMAHNDCSIRREGARKISEKKNWGRESKGTAIRPIPIDRFEPGGILDRYRIASYLRRDDELVPYGIDSAVSSYSYMYGELIEWLIDRLNHQKDEGPLEDIARWLEIADHPPRALISIGATRYTGFGEKTFLEPGDRVIVAAYDANDYDQEAIGRIARSASAGAGDLSGMNASTHPLSLLCQEVV